MNESNRFDDTGVYGKEASATSYVSPGDGGRGGIPGALGATARWLVLTGLLLAGHAVWAEQESAFEPLPYRLGEGLRLPGSGFGLGGYATVTADKLQHEPARSSLDNLSLFLWWEGKGRWKFFSEFDFENILSTRYTNRNDDDRYLALERIYLDYALDEATNLRIGKFLTPIGRWNLIHATPLVWTSSRPLVTQQTFPGNVTGLMLGGTLSNLGEAEYSLYTSSGYEIRANPAIDPFSSVIGGHLTLPTVGGSSLGFSYATFEQDKTPGERKKLVGIDFLWTRNRYELSAEGIYRFSDNGSSWDEKGYFAQLVVPLTEKLYAVGRYEYFRGPLAPAATQLWVTGLNYRMTPAIALKAEWISGKNNNIGAPEGLMSSVSILF